MDEVEIQRAKSEMIGAVFEHVFDPVDDKFLRRDKRVFHDGRSPDHVRFISDGLKQRN